MPVPASNRLLRRLQAFAKDDSAATLIEYGLIAMLIMTIIVTFVGDLSSQKLWSVFTEISSSLGEMSANNTQP